MRWKTKITQLTGIKYPVIMGAFAGVGRARFAAKFSDAGGLGIITALNFSTKDEFREELHTMKNLTNKPFGINFSIMPPEMAKRVINPKNEKFYLDFLDIALENEVKIFTTSAYQAPNIGKKIHNAGGLWFHKCTTLKHAQSAENLGADAITIVGLEGTGFKNPLQNTTLVNITMAKKLLKVPIIAAGGIGDARGFLAALAMGADAVCFGTAIMATEECGAPNSYKKRLIHQDIFDSKYHKKIFHYQLKDKAIWSPAAGHIQEIIPLKSFISNIISDAEKILRSWGYRGQEFSTL
ncbi:MAG: NAD(P)H-dependent flavin oxidoreductase [Candidatus Hermodarchaeota archaeon]